MNRNKVLGLLGLAEKAGKGRSGEFSTEKAVKSGKAGLVIVSEESSDNTKKCSGTCVLTIRSRTLSSEARKSSDTSWESR